MQMKGVTYVTDTQNRKIAIQIDLEKHGNLVENILDAIEAEEGLNEETITLEQLKSELKAEGKL